MNTARFMKGDWVRYKNGQYGRVKSKNDKYVFVVFNCGGEWGRFTDFTAEACLSDDLELKHPDGDGVCPRCGATLDFHYTNNGFTPPAGPSHWEVQSVACPECGFKEEYF